MQLLRPPEIRPDGKRKPPIPTVHRQSVAAPVYLPGSRGGSRGCLTKGERQWPVCLIRRTDEAPRLRTAARDSEDGRNINGMGIPLTEGGLSDILKFVEIVSIVGTGLFVVFRTGRFIGQSTERFERVTERFELIGEQQAKEITELKDTVKAIAVAQTASISDRAMIASQATLLAEMRTEINLMKQGRGFIRHRSESAIDGEYP